MQAQKNDRKILSIRQLDNILSILGGMPLGFTLRTARVLLAAAEHPGITQVEFIKRYSFTRAAVSRDVALLLTPAPANKHQGLGYLFLKENELKRTTKGMYLTNKGERFLDNLLQGKG